MFRVARGHRDKLVEALAVSAVLGGIVVLIALLSFVPAASAQTSVVDFSYTPAAPTAGEPLTFTSASSLQRPIVRENWDFNADGQVDADGHSVTQTFGSPGTYRVVLRVTDDKGKITSTSKLVTVSAGPLAPPPPPPLTSRPAPIPPPPPAPVPPPTTGSAAPMAIMPFPVVRITGSSSTLGTRLRIFAVTAPAGVRITVRCRGGGCPYRQRGPFVMRASGTRAVGGGRYLRIRGFRRRLLKPGVRLHVFVAHPDQIGKYTSFRIRRRQPPLRADRCLRPSATAFVLSCG